MKKPWCRCPKDYPRTEKRYLNRKWDDWTMGRTGDEVIGFEVLELHTGACRGLTELVQRHVYAIPSKGGR